MAGKYSVSSGSLVQITRYLDSSGKFFPVSFSFAENAKKMPTGIMDVTTKDHYLNIIDEMIT